MSREIFARAINFFREDVREAVGAYFDGNKIFVAHLAENVDTAEVDADSAELEHLAEKISLTCRQRGWSTSAVGFCLREGDAVTYQTAVDNLPAEKIPAFVKSWAQAQAGAEAAFAFTEVGAELWMETVPRRTLDDFSAAWRKFGMNLRGLSVMPADMLTKLTPLNRAEFVAQIVRNKKSPNLLARGSVWNASKISAAIATCMLSGLLICSAKVLLDHGTATDELDAEKISLDEMRDDLALKESLDADVAELNRLNKICAAQDVSPTRFNLLLNLGKVAGGGVRLTKIRADENFLELDGVSVTPDAVKSYLSRVKSSVAQSARLDSSTTRDGELTFTIRAAL